MALSAALAAFDERAFSSTLMEDDASALSSPTYESSLPELDPDTSSSTSSSPLLLSVITDVARESTNSHLAVLLPKNLWKQDSVSSVCDSVFCSVRFSLLERKHHCRKCGDVFCRACTSYSVPLLDTSKLDFILPPRNEPIENFDSPLSPVQSYRVCQECFDHLHRISSPSSPSSDYQRMIQRVPSSLRTESSYDSLSSCASSTYSSSSSSSRSRRRRSSLLNSPLIIPSEPSYGALDAYPLKRSSLLCKATGGGRWSPAPQPFVSEEVEVEDTPANPIGTGLFRLRFPRVHIQQDTAFLSTF